MGLFKSLLKTLFPDSAEDQLREKMEMRARADARALSAKAPIDVEVEQDDRPAMESITPPLSRPPATPPKSEPVAKSPTGQAKPFRLPTASSPDAVRVTIGLDFGTSGTKVVVNLEEVTADAKKFMAILLDEIDGYPSLIIPSAFTVHRGRILIGNAAEISGGDSILRSFKMCVPCIGASDQKASACLRCDPVQRGHFRIEGSLVDAVDISTLYLAIVLFKTKIRLKEHFGGKSLKLRVNSAAPLDQMTDKADLRGPFEKILFRAWRLSEEVEDKWQFSDAINALEKVKLITVPGEGDSPTLLIPETHAAMTAYILAPECENGLYATIDIGAGTTDVAFFWCGREDGVRKAWYYAARSEFIGIDDVDFALADLLGSDLGLARRRRELFNHVAFDEAGRFLKTVLDRFYNHYRRTFGYAYDASPGEKDWLEVKGSHRVTDRSLIRGRGGRAEGVEFTGRTTSCRRAKYILCLVGGGARVLPIATVLSQPLMDFLRFDDVIVKVPELPDTLRVLQSKGGSESPSAQCARQMPLLLLAYGLAHRSVDIPIWQKGGGRNREIRYRSFATHEEIYG